MPTKSRLPRRTRKQPLTLTAREFDPLKWYQLYSGAMLNLDHASMAGRIMDARSEILRRLRALKELPGFHEPERLVIQNALSGLRSLERGKLQYAQRESGVR